jgi:hypothetical protein
VETEDTRRQDPVTQDEEDREQVFIGAYVRRYVTICKELDRQWPDLHDKDAELFKSAASTIFIQMSQATQTGALPSERQKR